VDLVPLKIVLVVVLVLGFGLTFPNKTEDENDDEDEYDVFMLCGARTSMAGSSENGVLNVGGAVPSGDSEGPSASKIAARSAPPTFSSNVV